MELWWELQERWARGRRSACWYPAMRAAGVDAVGAMDYSPLVLLLCPPELVVLEQSSFQLMDWQGRVDLAVLLRMDEDHLDWHEDFKEYVNAKGNLLCDGSREGWPLVYLAEGHSDQLAKSHVGLRLAISLSQTIKEGVGFRGGDWWRVGSQPRPLPWLKQLRLEGDFHQENAAAAWLAAEWLLAEKLPAKKKEYRLPLIEESLKRFAGLPHRLQWVGDIKLDKHATSLKVRCYDDSYATRPRASQVAVTHFDQPLALIAGGTDKGASFSSLGKNHLPANTAKKGGADRKYRRTPRKNLKTSHSLRKLPPSASGTSP